MESVPATTNVTVAAGTIPGGVGTASGRARSRPDQFVRTLFRIDERPIGVSAQSAHTAFQRSMVVSALRCTLTYLVFPLLLPLVGIAAGVGPALGVCIGVLAITCDVFAIRSFFAADHRWRWYFAALIVTVVVFLVVLLVRDVSQLT
jgi:hypothetical protein